MRQARSAQPDPAGGAATLGTGRVGNVDVLRAVAALAVLVGHSYSLGGRSVPVKAQHWYDVPMITTATGVWLFFGISGYVISRSFVDRLVRDEPLPDVVSYAARRATRIFPLYWIALTAVIVIGSRDPTRGWQYPLHYLLLNNLVPGRQGALFSVAWTLTLELLFYIAVPVLAVAAKRLGAARSPERLAVVVIASWMASIGFTVVGDLVGGGETGLWLRGSFPAMWQMFCPGILLAIAPHLRAAPWRRSLVELPSQRTGLCVMVAALLLGALIGSCDVEATIFPGQGGPTSFPGLDPAGHRDPQQAMGKTGRVATGAGADLVRHLPASRGDPRVSPASSGAGAAEEHEPGGFRGPRAAARRADRAACDGELAVARASPDHRRQADRRAALRPAEPARGEQPGSPRVACAGPGLVA